MKFGRRYRAFLVLGACLAATSPSLAQTPKPLVLENFSERLSKDVPVSGRILVGAFVSRGEADKSPLSLEPRLLWNAKAIGAGKGPLCVTLASRDGQYYGEGTLSAARLEGLSGPTPPVRGDHSPSTQKHLAALPHEDLAVLAVTGDCRIGSADGKPAVVHVLDRRANAAPSGKAETPSEFNLHLLLNSMTYTLAVEAAIPNIGVRRATCRGLDDAQRNKAFNTACELSVPNADATAELAVS